MCSQDYNFYSIAIQLIGLFSIAIALLTYWKNSKTKRIEIIQKLYENFLSEKYYNFYEMIKNNVPFPIDYENEKMLNECLTFFDQIEYHLSLRLINKRTVIYFASEILHFWNNDTVRKYVNDKISNFENNFGRIVFSKEIAPFTGIKALAEIIEKPGIITIICYKITRFIIDKIYAPLFL
jgi:hypothetical protein